MLLITQLLETFFTLWQLLKAHVQSKLTQKIVFNKIVFEQIIWDYRS